MWRKNRTVSIINTFALQKANSILQNTRLIEMQILNFTGSRWDSTYINIHKSLLANLNALRDLSKDASSQVETDLISSVEETIRGCLKKLEDTAISNDKKMSRMSEEVGSDFGEDRVKLEEELGLIREQIEELGVILEDERNLEAATGRNNLENFIKNISMALEEIDTKGDENLKKTKEQLYKKLIKCSGKLKKHSKKFNQTVTQEVNTAMTHSETESEDTFDGCRNSESSGREYSDVYQDLRTFVLEWNNIKHKLMCHSFEAKEAFQITQELKGIELDMRRTSEYMKEIYKKLNSLDDIDEMKKIVERLRVVKKDIKSFSGCHEDDEFTKIKEDLNECTKMLNEAVVDDGMKCFMAKKKLRAKINEYTAMLDEKSLKP